KEIRPVLKGWGSEAPARAAAEKRGTDDHKIRQFLLRHRRYGEPRLPRHADQRSLLLERGAGEGDAQGRGLRQMHGRARLQYLLDGRAPFSARGDGIDSQPADDGDASVRGDQEPEDRLRL